MKRIETEVIVIGGGATGAGVLRDLSMRGIKAVLVEKDDIASGTTGRNHGLLHSGARYAVNDMESALECISENRILKRIASNCIEDTGGLFITLPHYDHTYHEKLKNSCRLAGISCDEISVKEALKIEPNLNSAIVSALHVPDGAIDPFRLAIANISDAEERGAGSFTYTRITSVIRENGAVKGVECFDEKTGNAFEIYANIVINASGIWSQHICGLAGVELKMTASKGAVVVIDYRINNKVVNACRIPANGDIIVPNDTVSLIGTTAKNIDYSAIDDPRADDDEIEELLAGGKEMLPIITRARVLRVYAGVRPLIAASGPEAGDGRKISRGIVLLDHEKRDGVSGFITITGGKLMTYRLMAEMAADLACKKLNVNKKCSTHKTPLPGSEKKKYTKYPAKLFSGIANSVVGSTFNRHGSRIARILKRDKRNYRLICECEMVTEGEIEYAIKNFDVRDLEDLKRRTRIGMGPCQGELCAYRSAGLFVQYKGIPPEEANKLLIDFIEERWKGMKPIFWGDAMREAEFIYWIYQGLFGMGKVDSHRGGDNSR
ncbi:MAG: anaerobic glycerol-3-phosphate dehydrogenase subunit A [Spirochaetes bacterium]|nr:anaerobic glycerol-3-phosphate dehydrogenase subunit A [Spirochaetota bacterium]